VIAIGRTTAVIKRHRRFLGGIRQQAHCLDWHGGFAGNKLQWTQESICQECCLLAAALSSLVMGRAEVAVDDKEISKEKNDEL
jgi:hypothetical protein